MVFDNDTVVAGDCKRIYVLGGESCRRRGIDMVKGCLLYTSDAADE